MENSPEDGDEAEGPREFLLQSFDGWTWFPTSTIGWVVVVIAGIAVGILASTRLF